MTPSLERDLILEEAAKACDYACVHEDAVRRAGAIMCREVIRSLQTDGEVMRRTIENAARYEWLRDDPRGRAYSVSSLSWNGDADDADNAIDAKRKAK